MRNVIVLVAFALAAAGMMLGCGEGGREVEIELDPQFHDQEPRQLDPDEERMWREQQEEMQMMQ